MNLADWPENFDRLHGEEESLRATSITEIRQSPDLSLHIATIEPSLNLIRHLILRDEQDDEDDLTVRLLAVRFLNDVTSSLKLLLSGYYQTATLIQRDMVETLFLLEDFQIDQSLITLWRGADEKTLKNQFSPIQVRMRVDKHYGHTEQKRAAAYKLYCELAAHPHPRGFVMLRETGTNLHKVGPFFDKGALLATISEMARHLIHFVEVASAIFFFSTREDREIQFSAFKAKLVWFKHFYEMPYNEADVANIRAATDRIPW